MARNRAMEIADGDIWLFLDDDVVLEPDFVEQLLAVYREYPQVDGVSGIITNYSRPGFLFRIWTVIFVRGPFRDERQPIYWNADSLRGSGPIAVFRFTGALMSFRATVMRGRLFDKNLQGVSDGEDIDFCIQLGPDAKLVIAPRARLEHRHSLVRLQDHWLRRSVRGNIFVYRKNWNKKSFNRLCYSWLVVGYSLVAIVASIRRLSLDPYRALRMGREEARRAVPLSRSERTA
jgi:GT2 family glycosyltransferase